ncbi:MAG TPA: ABC transporter ATP-binding protein [Phycisphaerae bacterium]|nr:ABC transporter ATP-binding protein [Phycisphaerae bacterium]HRW55032.1 ABC transporter ATP-binding protein [Phycisphaerae bacterium]
MTTATIELFAENVSKRYDGANQVNVLRGVSLSMRSGESAAIMGPSGCGKSTLLNILGGLEAPDSGVVRLGDEEPYKLDERSLSRFRNQSVGFIFQEHHLLPQCSVIENVLVPTLVRADGGAGEARAGSLLERVGLKDRMSHRPSELSGGERQRVAIARALINEPALLLADEPTGNLDERAAHQVADLLREIQRDTNTILIVVTHSAEIAHRFERQLSLANGMLNAT